MSVAEQINTYLAGQSEAKRNDLYILHHFMLNIMPGCEVWFLDGRNRDNKVVSNPTIGYGFRTIHYADGKTKSFYQIGISPNTTGISTYILGLADKTYLRRTYGAKLGKASISGYCIKFKQLDDINMDVLEAAMRYGLAHTSKT